MKKPAQSQFLDLQVVLDVLDRYDCPLPFHMVRALFMGSIASPSLGVSPMAALKTLWGGELPAFGDLNDVNALFEILIDGLWNSLTLHQSEENPFCLMPLRESLARADLGMLARIREQEIGAFLDGVYAKDDEPAFAPKVDEAVGRVVELHAMFDASALLLEDDSKPTTARDLEVFARNAEQLTEIAEIEINKVIQASLRARMKGAPGARKKKPAGSAKKRGRKVADAEVVRSPLSQRLTQAGTTVDVQIYQDGAGRWLLEVVDLVGTSHVWDEPFDTDQAALEEAKRALNDEPDTFAFKLPKGQRVH